MRKYCLSTAIAVAFCLVSVWAFAADGETLVQSTCTRCHDLGRVQAAMGVKDQTAWSTTVARMLAKPNAPAVGAEEQASIVGWLSAQKK
jgi:cytochrome c5